LRYGKYTDLVQDVIRLVESGTLLKPSQALAIENVALIGSFEEARKRAHFIDFETDNLGWTDIREREMASVHGASYKIEGFQEVLDRIWEIHDLFFALLKKQLDKEAYLVVNDILADLYNCAVSRSVCGTRREFFENMFRLYRLGGWPCGWEGKYPQGRMCVYFPELSVGAK